MASSLYMMVLLAIVGFAAVAGNVANGSGRFEKMEKEMQKSFLGEIGSKLGKKIEDSLGEEGMRKAGKVVDLVNNYFYEIGQKLQDSGWIVLKYPEVENANQKGKNVKQEQKQPPPQNHHVHREHDQQQEHVSEE